MAAPMFSAVNLAEEKFDAFASAGSFAGDWSTDYPLANVLDRRLHRVARSATAAEADSVFDLRLTEEVPRIDLVLLELPNATLEAEVRVTFFKSASSVNPGTFPVYPEAVPSGETIWGEDAGGSVTPEQWVDGKRWPYILIPTAGLLTDVNRITVEILDASNPDGYVEVGRFWAGAVWQSTDGVILQGAGFDPGVRDFRQETAGGSMTFDRRLNRPTWSFDFGVIDRAEHLTQVLEFYRYAGTTRQIVFIPDPDYRLGYLERGGLFTVDSSQPAGSPATFLYTQPITLTRDI